MNSTTEPIFADQGELVCRNVHWVDIVRFLAFNYCLHAVTVLSTPGEGLGSWVINRLLALFLPLVGTFKAVEVIYRCACMQKTPLKVALRAGALCMVYNPPTDNTQTDPGRDLESSPAVSIPPGTNANDEHPQPQPGGTPPEHKILHPVMINLLVTTVHGQHPFLNGGLVAGAKAYFFPQKHQLGLVTVPSNYTVTPLLPGAPKFDIAYNYNFVKVLAAIAQILYVCYQLYETSQPQISKSGYAAYQLTIIPYAIMSLINLFAALCQPEFPAMFLVRPDYPGEGQGEISAEVGKVIPPSPPEGDTLHMARHKKHPNREWTFLAFCALIVLGSIVGPYFIIWRLTGFKLGHNPDTVAFKLHRPRMRLPRVFNPWVVIWIGYSQLATMVWMGMAILDEKKKWPTHVWLFWVLGRIYFWVGVGISLYGFYSVVRLMVKDTICVMV